jgi:putative transposase
VYSVKYRLFPTKAQAASIRSQIEIHRNFYNHLLKQKIDAWETKKESLSIFTQAKTETPKFKSEICNYSSLQQTARRLDKTYKAFFSRGHGFPRFKSRFRTIEFGTYGDGWKFKKDRLYVQNVGLIKHKNPRTGETPKRLALTFDGDNYYATVVFDNLIPLPACEEKRVGIDMGMKDFIVMSSGEKIQNPEYYKKSLKRLRKQSKKRDSSETPRKEKIKKRIRKIHRKIANQRRDFLHKTARKIVLENSHIAVEDLKTKNLKSHKPINRKKSDLAWGMFLQILNDKAERAGRVFVKVNPAYTTQTCRGCGNRKKIGLAERVYMCECGHTEDRDIMAAKNILDKAFGCGATQLGDSPRSPQL